MAGGLHPVGFHVLNIVLHAVISALMIDVFDILIGGLAYDGEGRSLYQAPKTSLLAALLFGVHPVHTESVSVHALTHTHTETHSVQVQVEVCLPMSQNIITALSCCGICCARARNSLF